MAATNIVNGGEILNPTSSKKMDDTQKNIQCKVDGDIHMMKRKETKPVYTPEIDITWLVLMGLAGALRLHNLAKPTSVVFDEVHFGRYTSYFMQNKFFFDVHPPFGKLLYALAGYIAGFDGTFEFNEIGQEIPLDQMQYVYYLRLLPTAFSILLVPVVYEIILEVGCSYWCAVFGGLLVCFENVLVVQSKFILLDSMMLFFIAASVCLYIKFLKEYRRAFETSWWLYLLSLGFCLASAASTKYNGFLTFLLIGGIATYELWVLISDRATTAISLTYHFLARVLCLVVLPIIFYILQFYIMLQILYKSGPHDNIMSSAFQRTLEGGLETITKNQAGVIAYGSQITLRSTHSKQCWLHSHAELYPIKYPDGRGSSAQQQVTCYSFKDINNWWIVKHPENDDLFTSFPPKYVKNGDVIHLVHGTTGRGLSSHDVAAPLNPQLMEVSGYIDHNVSMDAQLGWRIEIINADATNLWKAIDSQVRLIHVNQSAAIKVSGEILPEWGFNQFEIGTDRMINTQESIFNVEEHNQNITLPEGMTEDAAKNILATQENTAAVLTEMPFFDKFWEIQMRMLKANVEIIQDHAFASRPTDWPIMKRGVAYWMDATSNKQIFCMGNPFIWWCASISLFIYIGLFIFYLLRRRRLVYDLSPDEWNGYMIVCYLMVGGYFINFLPFFPMERTLFTHHYLTSLLFKLILIPILADHMHQVVFGEFPILQTVFKLSCAVYTIAVIWCYNYFSVFTYGVNALSAAEIEQKKWFSTWDFLAHPGT